MTTTETWNDEPSIRYIDRWRIIGQRFGREGEVDWEMRSLEGIVILRVVADDLLQDDARSIVRDHRVK